MQCYYYCVNISHSRAVLNIQFFLIIAVFSSMLIPVVILTGIQISIPGLYLLTNMLIKI